MNFLLVGINSKYIHSNPAIYGLRSYLGDDRHAVSIAEYTINQEPDEIRSDIYRRHPDAIGFSCYIWNIRCVMDLAKDLTRLMPQIPVWFGGPEVSYRAMQIMQECPWLSGIMVGEGEEPFAGLVRRMLSGNDSPEGIQGLVYREKDGTIRDSGPAAGADFAHMPFIYSDMELPQNRIIYYETSRGCPYRCSYCLSSADRKIRFRDPDLVYRELQFFLDQKVPQVKFVDRTFNCVRERSRAIWRFLKEHDNGITNFHCEISADLLEEEDFEILSGMRKGLLQFEIGVQSTNSRTLKAIRREASLSRIFSAVRRVAALGTVHQHLDLIAGLPFEDYESVSASFREVYSLRPDQLQLGFLKVLSGTAMADEAESCGIIASVRPPYEVLQTRWLSYKELCRLKEVEEAVETFYNSRQFEAALRYLEERQPDSFALYEELGGFLAGLLSQGKKAGRRRLYESLADWLVQKRPGDRELIGELLTWDYFARECAKDRPSFCRPCSQWKTEEKEFYIREAVCRRFLHGYEDADSKQLQHMTHLEVFDWNIPAYIKGGKLCRKETAAVFLYRHRDFKSGNAEAEDISCEFLK